MSVRHGGIKKMVEILNTVKIRTRQFSWMLNMQQKRRHQREQWGRDLIPNITMQILGQKGIEYR